MEYTLNTFRENKAKDGWALALREDWMATQLRHPWMAEMYSALFVMPFLNFKQYSNEIPACQEDLNPLRLYTFK